jgi:hypothetical protein
MVEFQRLVTRVGNEVGIEVQQCQDFGSRYDTPLPEGGPVVHKHCASGCILRLPDDPVRGLVGYWVPGMLR